MQLGKRNDIVPEPLAEPHRAANVTGSAHKKLKHNLVYLENISHQNIAVPIDWFHWPQICFFVNKWKIIDLVLSSLYNRVKKRPTHTSFTSSLPQECICTGKQRSATDANRSDHIRAPSASPFIRERTAATACWIKNIIKNRIYEVETLDNIW